MNACQSMGETDLYRLQLEGLPGLDPRRQKLDAGAASRGAARSAAICRARTSAVAGRGRAYTGERAGAWEFHKKLPSRTIADGSFAFTCAPPLQLRAVPEQAGNWDWIGRADAGCPAAGQGLNLFGYTGGATIAAVRRRERTHGDPPRAWGSGRARTARARHRRTRTR